MEQKPQKTTEEATMLKLVLAFSIVLVVASQLANAKTLSPTDGQELLTKKQRCLDGLQVRLTNISTMNGPVKKYLNKEARKLLKNETKPLILTFRAYEEKVKAINVSKVNPQSKEFDEVMGECDSLMQLGDAAVSALNQILLKGKLSHRLAQLYHSLYTINRGIPSVDLLMSEPSEELDNDQMEIMNELPVYIDQVKMMKTSKMNTRSEEFEEFLNKWDSVMGPVHKMAVLVECVTLMPELRNLCEETYKKTAIPIAADQ